MINQLRTKNIWKELELLSTLIMIIFVSSLLPSLLVQYIYNDPQMMTTPVIFEIIPVLSFVIGVAMFLYVVISNLLREMQARALEKSLEMGTSVSASSPATNTTDLQAAMQSLSQRTEPKRRTKVMAAQRVTARSTSSKAGRATKRKK